MEVERIQSFEEARAFLRDKDDASTIDHAISLEETGIDNSQHLYFCYFLNLHLYI